MCVTIIRVTFLIKSSLNAESHFRRCGSDCVCWFWPITRILFVAWRCVTDGFVSLDSVAVCCDIAPGADVSLNFRLVKTFQGVNIMPQQRLTKFFYVLVKHMCLPRSSFMTGGLLLRQPGVSLVLYGTGDRVTIFLEGPYGAA